MEAKISSRDDVLRDELIADAPANGILTQVLLGSRSLELLEHLEQDLAADLLVDAVLLSGSKSTKLFMSTMWFR